MVTLKFCSQSLGNLIVLNFAQRPSIHLFKFYVCAI